MSAEPPQESIKRFKAWDYFFRTLTIACEHPTTYGPIVVSDYIKEEQDAHRGGGEEEEDQEEETTDRP